MYMIILTTWLAGFLLSYLMQRVEISSEGKDYTIGDLALNIVTSILSWVWILVILIVAWVKQVGKTGYWDKQIK